MAENFAPSWQPNYQSRTIAFSYFVSIHMIEKVFLKQILLKMCLWYKIKRKRSISKTATPASHLVDNNSEILPKFGGFVRTV